jgi:hypothetical protein
MVLLPETVLKVVSGIPRSNIMLYWMSRMSANLRPFRALFKFQKSQKLQGAKSGEWGGWLFICNGFLSQELSSTLRGIVMVENPPMRPEFWYFPQNRFSYSILLLLVFDLSSPRLIPCPHLHLSSTVWAAHFLVHLAHLILYWTAYGIQKHSAYS